MQSSISGHDSGIDRRQMLSVLGAGAVASAALPIVGCASPAGAEPVTVGGLAVTCNLTLPVACAANEAANHESGERRSSHSGTASTAAGRN